MKRIRSGSIALIVAMGLTFVGSPSFGHGAIHDQIDEITHRLEQTPGDAALYLKRAELHRAERSWDAALADYDLAERYEPTLIVVDLARARALLESGRAARALVAIDRFLEADGDSYDALGLRGRILAGLGRHGEAAADFTRAIALIGSSEVSEPDIYVNRAQALAAAGRRADAIASLDEGIARLGNLVVFDLLAIDLERLEGRFDDALARVDDSLAGANRTERWWLLRGEIQRQAGRVQHAQADFARALAAIESLPARQRNARRTLELEARVRSALARKAGSQR